MTIEFKTYSNLLGKPDSRKIESHSIAPIYNDGYIEIRTRKNNNGFLVSFASCYRLENGFQSHYVFSDYAKIVNKTDKNATVKNIEALHSDTMAKIECIIQDAINFYENKKQTA